MTGIAKRPWLAALAVAATAGLVVAAVATFLDWRLNPSGIFHDEAGTSWPVVLETAWSWFLPVALATGVGALIVLYLLRRPG